MTNKTQPKAEVDFLPYQHNPRKISEKQLRDLEQWLRELGDLSGVVHDLNSGQIVGGNQRSKVFDINRCEVVIEHRMKKPDEQGTVALGYVMWEGKRYNYRQVRWTKEQCDRANIVANKAGGAGIGIPSPRSLILRCLKNLDSMMSTWLNWRRVWRGWAHSLEAARKAGRRPPRN